MLAVSHKCILSMPTSTNRETRWHCHIHSKEVLLLLAWVAFFCVHSHLATSVQVMQPDLVFQNLKFALFLVYPVLGWIADSWLGWYKVITTSLYSCLLGWTWITIGSALKLASVLPIAPVRSFNTVGLLFTGLLQLGFRPTYYHS